MTTSGQEVRGSTLVLPAADGWGGGLFKEQEMTLHDLKLRRGVTHPLQDVECKLLVGEAEVGRAENHVLAAHEVEVNLLQKLLLWGVRVWRLVMCEE